MKIVTNKEYEEAYRNPEYLKIMNAASKRYYSRIPPDELHSCKLIGLWETLKRHREGLGDKFTTYLYKMVRYQCYSWVNGPGKKFDCNIKIEPYVDDFTQSMHLEEALGSISEDISQIIYQRFYQKLKLREIAAIHDCSIETIRRRIKFGIKELRRSFF